MREHYRAASCPRLPPDLPPSFCKHAARIYGKTDADALKSIRWQNGKGEGYKFVWIDVNNKNTYKVVIGNVVYKADFASKEEAAKEVVRLLRSCDVPSGLVALAFSMEGLSREEKLNALEGRYIHSYSYVKQKGHGRYAFYVDGAEGAEKPTPKEAADDLVNVLENILTPDTGERSAPSPETSATGASSSTNAPSSQPKRQRINSGARAEEHPANDAQANEHYDKDISEMYNMNQYDHIDANTFPEAWRAVATAVKEKPNIQEKLELIQLTPDSGEWKRYKFIHRDVRDGTIFAYFDWRKDKKMFSSVTTSNKRFSVQGKRRRSQKIAAIDAIKLLEKVAELLKASTPTPDPAGCEYLILDGVAVESQTPLAESPASLTGAPDPALSPPRATTAVVDASPGIQTRSQTAASRHSSPPIPSTRLEGVLRSGLPMETILTLLPDAADTRLLQRMYKGSYTYDNARFLYFEFKDFLTDASDTELHFHALYLHSRMREAYPLTFPDQAATTAMRSHMNRMIQEEKDLIEDCRRRCADTYGLYGLLDQRASSLTPMDETAMDESAMVVTSPQGSSGAPGTSPQAALQTRFHELNQYEGNFSALHDPIHESVPLRCDICLEDLKDRSLCTPRGRMGGLPERRMCGQVPQKLSASLDCSHTRRRV